jgi:hypothetical protein
LAVSIRDIRQGGNLEMHTYIVDMFIFGRSEGFAGESGLHQILVVLATEREMPTVRQSDGDVVVEEKRAQRHDPGRSKPRDENCGILQKAKAQATLYLGVLERVHHQFAGFRVPIEGMTKFFDLGETILCFNIKDAETAPWLRSVCNSAREMAIEAFSYQKGCNASSLDLLEMVLLD